MEWYFIFRFCKIWYFDCPSASAIWYFCLSLQLFWYFIFSSVFAIWYQLLQFDISVLSLQLFWYFFFSLVSAIWYLRSVSIIFFRVIFCLPLLQNLIFWLSFSFCNLVFSVLSLQLFWYFFFFLASTIWYFCSVSAICISTFLQLLQFDISVLSLQLFWYFVFSLIFAKSGISTFLQLLPWHLLSKRLFGYVDYLLIWEFSFLILLLWIVTTRVLFRLLTTWFFINEVSTLRSIFILLIIFSSMAPLLCLLFILLCRLQNSLSSRILFLVFVF